MSQPRFGRMIPAMVTPFDENRELDLDKAQALAARLVDGGSDSLIINGTTGESPTVFYPQKLELFRAVVEAVGDRCLLYTSRCVYETASTVAWCRALLSSTFAEIEILEADPSAAFSVLRFCQQWVSEHVGANWKSLNFLFTCGLF